MRLGQRYKVHNGSKLERISWLEVRQQLIILPLMLSSILIKWLSMSTSVMKSPALAMSLARLQSPS
jgi:hypothetical protein